MTAQMTTPMSSAIDKLAVTCVFYDGSCPLCSREIKLYRKLAEHDQAKGKNNDADLEWIDISKSKVELKAEGIKYADAMKLIHIKNASGVHQVGISAVLTIWDQIPYYRKLSKLLRAIPVIHPFLDKLYRFVANWRLKLNGGR